MSEYTLIDTRCGPRGIGGAIMRVTDEPTRVTVYVETRDISGDLAKIVAAGGKVIAPETVIEEGGAFGLFEDPDGHMLGLYDPKRDYYLMDLGGTNADGRPVVLFEWWAHDLPKLDAFFTRVFGWTITPMPPQPLRREYRLVDTRADGVGIAGGIMQAHEDGPFWGQGFYVGVDEIPSYEAKVVALGGKIVVPEMQFSAGSFGLFADPEGNINGLVRMSAAGLSTHADHASH